jgi:K+-transporting ATPase ATPase C chain
LFPDRARGSLEAGPDGRPAGSRLVAQPAPGAAYFQPRPSAVAYNAAAAGGSNWGASNPLLRDRVARLLGPVVTYRDGRPVAPDVEAWFRSQPGLAARWAAESPAVLALWAADPAHQKLVAAWMADNPDAERRWQAANPAAGPPQPVDLAGAFFAAYGRTAPTGWPAASDDPAWSVSAVFFDRWLQAHPDADLRPVPADLVMASGSGLDPHITLANASYQLDRVAPAWAAQTGTDQAQVREQIDRLLRETARAPLGGLAGEPLVNVFEVNTALREQLGPPRPGVGPTPGS